MAFTDPAFEQRRAQLLGGKVSTPQSKSVPITGSIAKPSVTIGDPTFEQRRAQLLKSGPQRVDQINAPKTTSSKVKPIEKFKITKPSSYNVLDKTKQAGNIVKVKGKEFIKEIADINKQDIKEFFITKEKDRKRSNEAFKAGVKKLPSDLVTQSTILADSWSKQQNFVNQYFKDIPRILRPMENLGGEFFGPKILGKTPGVREKAFEKGKEATKAYGELGEADNFGQKVKEALLLNLPQMALTTGMTIATAVVSKNPILATTVGLSSSYGQGANEVYTQARQDGQSDKEALPLSMLGGVLIGAIDFLPLGRIISKTGAVDSIKKSIIKKIAGSILSTSKQSGLEGVTEGFQEIIGNAIAQTYDENKKLFENVGLSTVVGAIFGSGADISVQSINTLGNIKNSKNIEKKIKKALDTPEDKRSPEEKQIADAVLTQTLTPDEAIGVVVDGDLENTAKGKELMKVAIQAKQDGEEVVVKSSPDGQVETIEAVDRATTIPDSVPDVIKEEFEGKGESSTAIQTQSGREIPAPPGIRDGSSQKQMNDVKSINKWLVEQGIAEAELKGDEFNLQSFKGINPLKITQAERDSLNYYLFGRQDYFDQSNEQQPQQTEETQEDDFSTKTTAELRDIMDDADQGLDEPKNRDKRDQKIQTGNKARDILNEAYEKDAETIVEIPTPNYAIPALEIKTFKYSDGTYAVKGGIHLGEWGYGGPFGGRYKTKEEAVQAEAKYMLDLKERNVGKKLTGKYQKLIGQVTEKLEELAGTKESVESKPKQAEKSLQEQAKKEIERISAKVTSGELSREEANKLYAKFGLELGDVKDPLTPKQRAKVLENVKKTSKEFFEKEAKEKDIDLPEQFKSEAEEKAFRQLIENTDKMVNDLIEKFDGKISSDDAKTLFTGYNKTNSPDYDRPSGNLAKLGFREQLKRHANDKDKVILFTAGGPGSGKTTIADEIKTRAIFSFEYDSNLADAEYARKILNEALNADYRISVLFIDRNPLVAWKNGVLQRFYDNNPRTVTVLGHVNNHIKARKTIVKLWEEFYGKKVDFVFYDNSKALGKHELTSVDFVKFQKYNKEELIEEIKYATRQEYAKGNLTKEQTIALLGKKEEIDVPSFKTSDKPQKQTSKELENLDKDIPLDLAIDAHRGTSFMEDKRGQSEIDDYVTTLTEDYNKLQKLVKDEEGQKKLDYMFESYRKRYAEATRAMLSSRSRVMSPMITGPAKFPNARNAKRSDAYKSKVEALNQIRDKSLKRIANELDPRIISSDDSDAISKLREKLDNLRAKQEIMLNVNKVIRKGVDVEQELKFLGMNDESIKQLLTPYMGRKGFQPFELTNNNAKIKSTEQRIASLSKIKSQESTSNTFSGGKVEVNTDANRIQIFYDSIPDVETRTNLKRNGFRWSPYNKAWQRQITPNAIRATENILGVKLNQEKPKEVEPQKTDLTLVTSGLLKNGRPTIGTPDFIDLLAHPEFNANPVLTVNENKELVFEGDRLKFRIEPEAMNLMTQNLVPGDKISVNRKDLKANQRQMRVNKNGSFYASVDNFANVPNETLAEKSLENVVEFPELVKLAKEMMGNVPSVKTPRMRKIGRPNGYFQPAGNGKIVLNPEIFKSPGQAVKTLAHELGHLTDWLDEKTMARGNLLGRLASLRGFMRQSFTNVSTEAKIDDLTYQRNSLRAQRKALRNEKRELIDKKDQPLDSKLLMELKGVNKRIKMLREGAITHKEVRDELIKVTQAWKPFDPQEVPEAYLEYRYSPEELYADAISMLFNDPVLLKKTAPTFWKMFFENIDQKPSVKKNFFELWDLLHKGEEAVFQERDKALSESFAKGEEVFVQKELEKQKRGSSIMYQLRLLFDNKNTPIIYKINQARKAGKTIPPQLNPEYALAGMNYSEGKLMNFVDRNFEPIFKKILEVPNGWEELGKILFYERVINERGELANPQGYDPKTAGDQLRNMEKQFTTEEWATLQEAKGMFRKAVQKVVTMAEENEFYTPELLKQMKMNPAYASYQVIDYLDTYISARAYKSLGTLKDIANPATSTVMKLISVYQAMERNKAKLTNINFMKRHFPGEIQDAKTKWNGRSMEVVDTRDPGQGLVITIEKGKPKGYYVEDDIATMLNFTPNKDIIMASNVVKLISGSPIYRPLFTSLSVGFQTFNFERDFMRYWKNVPDYTFIEALTSFPRAGYRYGQAFVPSAKRALGIRDALITEMQDKRILGLTYIDTFKSEVDSDVTQIERILAKAGIKGIIEHKKTLRQKVFLPAIKFIDGLQVFSDFIETLPKVAGYKELKGKMPDEELANFIRTSIGSPDFRKGGTLTPVSNNLLLFSNAQKEGIKSDLNIAFTKNPSRAGFWWKTVMGTFLPKIIMAGALYGLFGDELEDIFKKATEYDKTNYTIIPIGIDRNGKAIYQRLPQDETGRLFGAIFWKMITFNEDKKSIEDIFEVFSIGAGQFPSLSPNFETFSVITQYLSGRNPYDAFRGRNIIPDTEFKAGPKESLPILLDWLAQASGLGIVLPRYNVDKEATDLEKVLNLPVLSNILGRWIKVTNYGEVEKLNKISKEEDKVKAQEKLNRDREVEKAVEEFGKSDKSRDSQARIERNLIDTVIGKVKDSNDKRMKTNLIKNFRIQLQKGKSDPLTNALIYAGSNDEKIKLLRDAKEELGDNYNKFLAEMKKDKIISDEVLKQVR